jgi:hypothetical protein
MKINRRGIGVFFGVLVFAAGVHAGMMPVSQKCAVCRHSCRCCAPANHQCENLFGTPNCTCIADLDVWSVGFLLEANTGTGQASEIQPLSLTDGPNSLEFCLSALISLGLCSSLHWVRKIHLGFIPQWYHEGRPFQIGHSHALMPGTLCPAPACCFIQPFRSQDNHLPQYFLRTIISLWWKSQFTLAVITSRGPPLRI